MNEAVMDSQPRQARATQSDGISVLVVDDEPMVAEAIALCLEPAGHRVTATGGVRHARAALGQRRFDLALLDLRLGDGSGLDLVPELLETDATLPVVVMTAYGSVESAVEAMRRGAADYLAKPIAPPALQRLLDRIVSRRRLHPLLPPLAADAGGAPLPPLLETTSPVMARAIATARRVAPTDATVLLTGESGTGKGVLARALHDWSGRAARPFGVVNCPSLSAELLRSELFGHVKGAFTGATDTKIGKIAFADGGTLLLDEIGELDAEIQPRLLRFLQDREYERVGDPNPRHANVRLIAATNRDLQKAVSAGAFRDDLFYRLNVIQIELAPLRARRDDIEPLAEWFLQCLAARYGKDVVGFTGEALAVLREQPWPGNVRELQNAVERAVILGRSVRIGASALPRAGGNGPLDRMGIAEPGELTTLAGMEKRYIRHVMEVTGSVEQAAEVLGVAPSTLWRRRRRYGI